MKIEIIDGEIKKLEIELKNEKEKARKEDILKAYQGDDKIISWEEVAEKIRKSPPIIPMPTGHERLDKIMGGGFGRKQLIALTAITKNGKTAFSVDLTRRLEKYNPLWFPFEETIEELVRKQIEYGAYIPRNAYTPQNCPTDSLNWIEERILESVIKNDSRVIFIDHLHFIGLEDQRQERHDLKLTEVIKNLKKMAKRLDVCIILIAHLRKVDITQQPTITDIKETSSLAQWSDKVLILWREAEKDGHKINYTDVTYLTLAADRQTGNLDSVPMKFTKGVYDEISDGEALLEQSTITKKKKKDF